MQTAIIYPVVVQIFLTLLIGIRMASLRGNELRSSRISPSEIAVDNANWPDDVRKCGNSYSNQFEMPVLFYVLCILAMLVNMADFIAVALAWIFVISRIVHAFIHNTHNNLTQRGLVFSIGAAVVALQAMYLLIRLLAVQI
ncbi:MAG: MAPEG family protein [Hyphomicrobiales bacterium]|nr:MAPEG family protein [Hyphomicrobiales bacterium]